MPKIKARLKKLVDVDVEFVSLVKRGANRLPIRIIKSEDVKQDTEETKEMSFLDKIFGNKEASQDDSTAPEITAIITDNDNAELMEKQLEEVGFSISEKQEVEGGTVFRQGELSSEDVIIQLSQSTYVAIKNVQKAFEPFSSGTSFADNFKKGAFFPSVRMATDVLMDTIVNIMFDSDGDKAPTEEIKKTLNEFSSFVITSLKSIPKDAFKLEELIIKALKEASDKTENSVAKSEDEPVDIKQVTEEVKKGLGEFMRTDAEKAVAKMEEMKVAITKSIVEVKEQIDAKLEKFEADIKALKDVSDGIDKRLIKNEEKSDELEKTVKGTVTVGSTDVDPDKSEDSKKSDENKDDIWEGSMNILDSFGE